MIGGILTKCFLNDLAVLFLLIEFCDVRQELVFIGIDVDRHLLTQRLDSCLLTDIELDAGPDSWIKYYDPFPAISDIDLGHEKEAAR